MSNNLPAAELSWKRSRYGFAGFWFLSLLAAWFVLRLVLLLGLQAARAAGGAMSCSPFSAGFIGTSSRRWRRRFRCCVWMLIVPDRRFGALWHRVLFLGGCFVFWFVQIFLLFVEFFFFDEFKSRFNTVAVDYLLYPKEVFINIWESYHVGVVLAICLVLSLGWLFAASRLFGQMWERPFPAKSRLLHLAAVVALAALLAPTLNLKGAHVSNDRTLNEMANNGALSFIAAAWTHNLDYARVLQDPAGG